MVIFAGAVLLILGLVAGLFLVLQPFGIGPANLGWSGWIMFPAFTAVGYLMFAVGARHSHVSLLSRIGGGCLVLLALAAAIGLFAIGSGLVHSRGEPLSLWYVLGLGLAFGASGFAIARFSAGAEPAEM
jgi:hypothetical protein